MFLKQWFRWLKPAGASRSRKKPRRRKFRPELENLEVRTLPSTFTGFDINPTGPNDPDNSDDSQPRYITNSGGVAFFAAFDGVHGYELWKSDPHGTTALVKDINPGTGSSFRDTPTYQAWMCDVNGTLFFVADDGTHGEELWKSDGTSAGTVLVKDIHSGSGSATFGYMTNVSGSLYFTVNDGVNGSELWKSDGTTSGTVMVKDINPGADGSAPDPIDDLNGTLLFGASDTFGQRNLWKTDGTQAGTVKVKDMADGAFLGAGYSAVFNNAVYFLGGSDLWKTDGTESGTILVKDLDGANNFTVVGTTLFFIGTGGADSGLWKSDGTGAGTTFVKNVRAWYLTAGNGALYFVGPDPDSSLGEGDALWRSDGTTSGTVVVADMTENSYDYFHDGLVYVEATKTIYFTAWVRNQSINALCICTYNTITGAVAAPSYGIVEPALTEGGYITFVPGTGSENGFLFFFGWGNAGGELWRMNL